MDFAGGFGDLFCMLLIFSWLWLGQVIDFQVIFEPR
jgi:hypothetical protein